MEDIIEYIYRLEDPRNNEVRYVGRTLDAFSRFVSHLSGKNSPEKYAWIQELKAEGLIPNMVIIEAVIFDPNGTKEQSIGGREAYWIQHYREQNARLFNKPHPSYWRTLYLKSHIINS